jgi:hypothetical protein
MGFGKNKSESSQGFDPQLKAALLSVFGEGQRLYNNLEFKPYEAARVAPMSPFQQEGLNQTLTNARGQLGNSELNDARAIFSRSGSYNPNQVNAQGIGHRDVRAQGIGHRDINVAAMGAQPNVMANNISNVPLSSSRDVSNTPGVAGQSISPMALLGSDQVNAERFSNTNLNPYLNQYEDQVVNQTIGDIDRARQMQQGQNNASAVAAGAFGGDRQAIQRAETDRNALEATARQVGQLRQGGYESAARRAEGDISRNLTGQQSNQASNSQTGQFNIGNEFNRQQANQARDLTQSQANASNNLQMQRANQAADISNSQNNAANNMAMQRSNQDANLRSQVQNQNMGFQTGQQNQNSAMQQQQLNQRVNFDAQRANQAARLQAAQGNQDTNFAAQRANQDARLRAGIQNQNAGLQGMQQQLQAGRAMQGLGQDYRDFANQDAQNIFGVGSFQQQQAQRIMDDQYQRYQQEQEYPFKMFDLLRAGAGLLPSGTVGSSSSSGFNVGLPGGS